MKTEQFGYHLTLDLYECKYEHLVDMEYCFKALDICVGLLGMRKMIPPYIIKADGNTEKGGKDPGGLTGFVVIEESHISIHTFAKRGFVSLDVYSCKEFDKEIALEFFKKTFKPLKIEHQYINRGINYPSENIY